MRRSSSIPAPEPLTDDIEGGGFGSPALYGLGSVLQERGGGGSGRCPCHFYKAPHQPLHRIPDQSGGDAGSCSPSSLITLYIQLMSFHQRCAPLLSPSSHPLTLLLFFCISAHTPCAGYRLFLHYGWFLRSSIPLSLLFYFLPAISPPPSVFHLGSPSVGSCHYGAVRQKRERGWRRYITVTLALPLYLSLSVSLTCLLSTLH